MARPTSDCRLIIQTIGLESAIKVMGAVGCKKEKKQKKQKEEEEEEEEEEQEEERLQD